jgi:hypothetical protein
MAKVRQLLHAADIEVAVRRRICHHNRKQHSIAASTKALVVKDPASGATKNYCPECAEQMFVQVERDLATLRTKLSGS